MKVHLHWWVDKFLIKWKIYCLTAYLKFFSCRSNELLHWRIELTTATSSDMGLRWIARKNSVPWLKQFPLRSFICKKKSFSSCFGSGIPLLQIVNFITKNVVQFLNIFHRSFLDWTRSQVWTFAATKWLVLSRSIIHCNYLKQPSMRCLEQSKSSYNK